MAPLTTFLHHWLSCQIKSHFEKAAFQVKPSDIYNVTDILVGKYFLVAIVRKYFLVAIVGKYFLGYPGWQIFWLPWSANILARFVDFRHQMFNETLALSV